MIQEKKRALGRGLESLIPTARTYAPAALVVAPVAVVAAPEAEIDLAPGERVQEIRLEEIEPSPYQPRRRQDEAALEELTQSIRAQGVLQPIVIRYTSQVDGSLAALGTGSRSMVDGQTVDGRRPMVDGASAAAAGAALEGEHATTQALAGEGARATSQVRYQLIAGERRWLASRRAGRATVPAIVRQVSNQQAMEMALIENLQREDLDCMEMAFAFDRLGRDFGLTQDEMSKRTGKDRTTVSNLLRLLKLPPEVRTSLSHHDLSFSHAKSLMSLEDATVLSAAAQKVVRDGLSVRQTEELVSHLVWLGPVSEKENKDRHKKAEDPNVRAARIDLEQRLGCRVKIQDKNGKGRVVIEYKSLEDFDRILEALGRN
ncbi:MAG: ParB/RepB/Spo0J family partition protein [Terriglobales bacterium]|jgi:ParB family chromosome partitioning protein